MREGLRSAVVKEELEGEEVLDCGVDVGIDVGEDKDLNFKLMGSGDLVGLEDGCVEKECREDADLGGYENSGFTGNGRKRGRRDGVGGGRGVKKVRKDVPISGRVLRSRSSAKKEELNGGVSARLEKKPSEIELVESDLSVGNGGVVGYRSQMESLIEEEAHKVESLKEEMDVKAEPLVESLKEDEVPEVKEEETVGVVKRKRGRPPVLKVEYDMEVVSIASEKCKKVKLEDGERNELPEKSKRRGRPPKLKVECKNVKFEDGESNGSLEKSKRRGRPPKAQSSDGALKTDLEYKDIQEGSKKNRRGTKSVGVIQKPPIKFSYMDRKCKKKKLKSKRFLAMKNKNGNSGINDNEVSAGRGPKVVPTNGVKTNQKEVKEGSSREAKQLVRDQIVEILMSAGWRIEYRQRNGRDYRDAVYVNPEGKTHWSVTLAYRVFLEQYKAGRDNSKSSYFGFTFTPIPEEELGILKKIITKQRSDKNQSRLKGQSGDTSDEEVTELKQRKEKLPTRNRKRQRVQSKRRCALLARNSKEGVESDIDSYTPYNGKRTVLAWMIDMGIVPLNVKVQYKNQRTDVKLEGRVTADGIHCECCSKIFTIPEFEIHAGSEPCRPLENIYLENGSSLLQCQLDSWNKQDESEHKGFHLVDVDDDDPSDDTCGICGDGGDLICCDGCPSTFHQSCLDIEKFPSGDWHCVYCSCKYCGIIGGKTLQEGDTENTGSTLLTCHMCKEKYHESCMQPGDTTPDNLSGPSFCGMNCQELFERLQMLLGVRHELKEGFSWRLVRRSDVIISDISQSGAYQHIESNSKLAVALHVMNECFLPLIDHRSGNNLFRNILYNYGSNFNRLNYSGFVTAILERDDEIISAASIRIHGNHLAEMPFIGTRYQFRRQGMCRRLLSAIESALCSLRVEKLVIPAISELRQTWTSIFGFKPLESSSWQKMRNMNLLVFPGVDMLQKPILSHPEEIISSNGLECIDLGKEHEDMKCSADNSDEKCPAEPDSKINGELATADSISQHADGSLTDTSNATHETGNNVECILEADAVLHSGTSHSNIEEENERSLNSSHSEHDVNDIPVEEVVEDQNPDLMTVELHSQLNHQTLCKHKSSNRSEATTQVGAEIASCEATKCNIESTPLPVHASDLISSDDASKQNPTLDSCFDLKEAPAADCLEDPKQTASDLISLDADLKHNLTVDSCCDLEEAPADGCWEDPKQTASDLISLDADSKHNPTMDSCCDLKEAPADGCWEDPKLTASDLISLDADSKHNPTLDSCCDLKEAPADGFGEGPKQTDLHSAYVDSKSTQPEQSEAPSDGCWEDPKLTDLLSANVDSKSTQSEQSEAPADGCWEDPKQTDLHSANVDSKSTQPELSESESRLEHKQ